MYCDPDFEEEMRRHIQVMDEARTAPPLDTPSKRFFWLKAQFDLSAKVNERKPAEAIFTLKDTYEFDHAKTRRKWWGLGPLESALIPVSFSANNWEDAANELHERVLEASGGIVRYLPKEGQEFEAGKAYQFVRQQHRLHDHESPRLLNLVPVEVYQGGCIHEGSLKASHYHLLIK